jgi:enterochelin esterase family protein
VGAVLLASVAGAGPSADLAAAQGAPTSPTIEELETRSRAGDTGAVRAFWETVAERGAPIVERAGPGRSVVTFVFRGGGDVTDVRVESGLLALEVQAAAAPFGTDFDTLGGMARIPSADVWYRSYVVANDLRLPYVFSVARAGASEPARELDPLNPTVYDPHERFRPESVVELPGAPPQPWRGERGEGPGRWHQVRVVSGGDSTVVYVYTPEAYDPDRTHPYPLFVGLNSYTFGIAMPGDWILEHLIRRGEIEPVVMLLVDAGGDGSDAYRPAVEFLADDVLPTVRRDFHVAADPHEVAIGGTSRRGLVSGIVAFERPDLVANVIALSGSFYWKPAAATEYEWLAGRVAASASRDVRWFLRAGNLETVVTPGNHGHYMVATNRHMRDVLRARGYDLDYAEFTGVHSDLNWQSALADGLRHFFGR